MLESAPSARATSRPAQMRPYRITTEFRSVAAGPPPVRVPTLRQETSVFKSTDARQPHGAHPLPRRGRTAPDSGRSLALDLMPQPEAEAKERKRPLVVIGCMRGRAHRLGGRHGVRRFGVWPRASGRPQWQWRPDRARIRRRGPPGRGEAELHRRLLDLRDLRHEARSATLTEPERICGIGSTVCRNTKYGRTTRDRTRSDHHPARTSEEETAVSAPPEGQRSVAEQLRRRGSEDERQEWARRTENLPVYGSVSGSSSVTS